jgi:hypothetical protein
LLPTGGLADDGFVNPFIEVEERFAIAMIFIFNC